MIMLKKSYHVFIMLYNNTLIRGLELNVFIQVLLYLFDQGIVSVETLRRRVELPCLRGQRCFAVPLGRGH